MTDDPKDPEKQKEIEAFEAKQARDLEAFEAEEGRELQAFEGEEHRELEVFEHREARTFTIKIDRTLYKVHEPVLTGQQLRDLVDPPIGADRDLFEVVPGGSDKKIANDEPVEMRDGLRFFTAPAQINPGAAERS
ncbi:MAG TPA: multiubiquitin domain-containing protein [Caulobacteraceae bacterium]|jgi:hypothetical protein